MEPKLTCTAIVFIGLLYAQTLPAAEGHICPPVPCDSNTLRCPYRTFFSLPTGKACRSCNMCVNPGSPTDSSGCPLMECEGPVPVAMCKDPRYYNSWLDYRGRKCPTCWANVCRMKAAIAT